MALYVQNCNIFLNKNNLTHTPMVSFVPTPTVAIFDHLHNLVYKYDTIKEKKKQFLFELDCPAKVWYVNFYVIKF